MNCLLRYLCLDANFAFVTTMQACHHNTKQLIQCIKLPQQRPIIPQDRPTLFNHGDTSTLHAIPFWRGRTLPHLQWEIRMSQAPTQTRVSPPLVTSMLRVIKMSLQGHWLRTRGATPRWLEGATPVKRADVPQ